MSFFARILMFLPRWHQSAAVTAQATDINSGNERRRDSGVTFLWSWLWFDYICGVIHVAGERHDWWGRLIFSLVLFLSCFTLVPFFNSLHAFFRSLLISSQTFQSLIHPLIHFRGAVVSISRPQMQRAGSRGVCTIQGPHKNISQYRRVTCSIQPK